MLHLDEQKKITTQILQHPVYKKSNKTHISPGLVQIHFQFRDSEPRLFPFEFNALESDDGFVSDATNRQFPGFHFAAIIETKENVVDRHQTDTDERTVPLSNAVKVGNGDR